MLQYCELTVSKVCGQRGRKYGARDHCTIEKGRRKKQRNWIWWKEHRQTAKQDEPLDPPRRTSRSRYLRSSPGKSCQHTEDGASVNQSVSQSECPSVRPSVSRPVQLSGRLSIGQLVSRGLASECPSERMSTSEHIQHIHHSSFPCCFRWLRVCDRVTRRGQ
jgi:hypothetical protein